MSAVTYRIAKTQDEERLVFGFASVSVKDGAQLVDLHGDMIDPVDLEKAAYAFVEEYGGGINEMHDGPDVGHVVESFYLSPDKLTVMGFPEELTKTSPTAHWIGVRVSPETFAKVKSGALSMFSIEGRAVREPV